MATRVKRSALLPYAAEAVFDIVNDVSRYPEFLPWCSGAEVVEVNTDEVIASLSMRLRGLNETFTTRNILTPHERIDLELVSGPFKAFSGHWLFTRLGDAGCQITCTVDEAHGSPSLDLHLVAVRRPKIRELHFALEHALHGADLHLERARELVLAGLLQPFTPGYRL